MKQTLLALLLILPVVSQAQCNQLRKKTDKFTGEISITTDLTEPIAATRAIKKDTTYVYLRLTAPATANANRQGAFVLFSDGSRLEWPSEEVEVRFTATHLHWNSNIEAKSFVGLTSAQVRQLSKQRITDYKLYVYDWALKEKLGESFRKQFECLISVNPETVKER